MRSACDTHPDVSSLTACSLCGRPFCDPCLPALVDGLCACAGCARSERAQTGRPWGFAATVLVACGLGSFAFARANLAPDGPAWEVGVIAVVLAVGFAGFIVSRKRTGGGKVEVREPGHEPEDARPVSRVTPYRQAARRALARRLPPISGRLTAFTLLMCCGFCALTMPFALHLPRWVEAEIVFGASWFVWAAVLTNTLYRGERIADDHRFEPSLWFLESKPGPAGVRAESGGEKSGGGWGSIGNIGDIGEAAVLLGAILLACAAVLTAWLLVELVIPALFTLAYLLLIRALKLATNDGTGCRGDLGRSLRRGALFATLYVGPLLVLAAIIHLVARKSGVF
jgi:hypothetical protein